MKEVSRSEVDRNGRNFKSIFAGRGAEIGTRKCVERMRREQLYKLDFGYLETFFALINRPFWQKIFASYREKRILLF